jgi:hypothetical protein
MALQVKLPFSSTVIGISINDGDLTGLKSKAAVLTLPHRQVSSLIVTLSAERCDQGVINTSNPLRVVLRELI